MTSGIASKIWFVSVLCNTVFITGFLGIKGGEINTETIGPIFGIVLIILVLNLVFSLPAFFLFWIVLRRCSVRNLKSSQLHAVVITAALGLTTATYLALILMFDLWDADFLPILFLSLVSALAGIAFQWRALRELSIDKYTVSQES